MIGASTAAVSVDLLSHPRAHLPLAEPYFDTADPAFLGHRNLKAARGNPLKGLVGGIRWAPPPLPDNIPLSLECFNVGLKEVMIGDDSFDWSVIENLLQGSANRKNHCVFSPYIHWPGQELQLPDFLVGKVKMTPTDNGPSPDYGDPLLLRAIEQFIRRLAQQFDGDKRIAAVHVGLLGFWGEFHTYPYENILPESSKDAVIGWYQDSFTKTQLQARYPRATTTPSFGYHDDSFCYSTVDGKANGGVDQGWFFVPRLLQQSGAIHAWRTHMMGGETFPELQPLVFQDNYPGGTEFHQDFLVCTETIHATYMTHHDAFANGGYKEGSQELRNALVAHDALGYNFCISRIALTESTNASVNVAVTLTQLGVAPFYYDLSLLLVPLYSSSNTPHRVDGIEKLLVDKNESTELVFADVPEEYLGELEIRLVSSYAYNDDKPIRFAQGTDGIARYKLPSPRTCSNVVQFTDNVCTESSP